MCEATSVLPEARKNKGFCSVWIFWFYPKTALSFRSFPVNSNVRGKWIQAIWREEGPNFVIKKGSTYVCSRHFTSEDYILGCNVSRLIPRAVPIFTLGTTSNLVQKESIRDRSDKRLSVLFHHNDLASYVSQLYDARPNQVRDFYLSTPFLIDPAKEAPLLHTPIYFSSN